MKKKIKYALVLIILSVGTIVGWYFTSSRLKPCTTNAVFDHTPIKIQDIDYLTPLGVVAPPGHTYPTDHMYFYTDWEEEEGAVELYSPGNITLTKISKTVYTPKPGHEPIHSWDTDYELEFAACREITGLFGHVINLTDELENRIGDFSDKNTETWSTTDATIVCYNKEVSIKLSSGDLMGKAAPPGVALDLTVQDSRVSNYFVNKDIQSYEKHIVCPLDYFTEGVRNQLEPKLGGLLPGEDEFYNLTLDQAGTIAFDKDDTAQGVWTVQNIPEGMRSEDVGLSLVNCSLNSSKGAISIGSHGFSWDCYVYYFEKNFTGKGNRDFSDVSADGNVYWYHIRNYTAHILEDQCILIKLIDNHNLKFQYVDLEGVELPSDPTSLWNRDENDSIHFVR